MGTAEGKSQAKLPEDDDIDDDVVDDVGDNKAVPLLPEEEDGAKELVIHVPEETAKTAEIGVLSGLLLLILLASAIAIAYFVYDRKRQKQIKECVDKLTEEGVKKRDSKTNTSKNGEGNHKRRRSQPALPPSPAPFSASDDTPSSPFQPLDDETATMMTSEEPPETEGGAGTEVTSETEERPVDDANNNWNRNATSAKGGRCCLCFCCRPKKPQPSLEEIWKQKKISQKKGQPGFKHSLQPDGSRHGIHHHRHATPITKQPGRHPLPQHRNLPRRHRSSSRHGRSQSVPPPSRSRYSAAHTSHNNNRSCWSQAALQKKRSLSLSPDLNRNARLRKHRHSGKSKTRRGRERDRGYVQERHTISRSHHRGPCLGQLNVRERVGDYRRSRSRSKNERGSRHQCSRTCQHDGGGYYVKNYPDGSQKITKIEGSRSRVPCKEIASSERHHRTATSHSGHRRDINYGQRHPSRKTRVRESLESPERYEVHQRGSYGRSEHHHHPHRQPSVIRNKLDMRNVPKHTYVDSNHRGQYLPRDWSQERVREEVHRGRTKHSDLWGKKVTRNVASPAESYVSQATDNSLLYSVSAQQHAFPIQRPQHRSREQENRNQSAYRSRSYNPSQFRPSHYSHSKGGYVVRALPYTDGGEGSVVTVYDQHHHPYPYHGHLNVSQNYHCEDNDLVPCQHNPKAAAPAMNQADNDDEAFKDNNDELSDNNETRSAKRKVHRKRPRLKKTSARWKRLSTPVKTEGRDTEQHGSTSSEGEREETSLARRLFGLRLSSQKRSKRQTQRPSKKRKQRGLSTEQEHQPLLGGHTSWDSEDTTYEASKGTELMHSKGGERVPSKVTEPIDSGYDLSASFLSEPHLSDLTLTQCSPFPSKNNPEKQTIPPLNPEHQQKHNADKCRKEQRSRLTDEDNSTAMLAESSTATETRSNNNNCVCVSRTGVMSPDDREEESSVLLKHLGTQSTTGVTLARLDGVSREEQREFRQLATQRWCEQQMPGGHSPQVTLYMEHVPRDEQEECKTASTIQTLEISSLMLKSPGKVSRRYSTSEGLPPVEDLVLSTTVGRSPKSRAFDSAAPHSSTCEEGERCSVVMDHMDFASSSSSVITIQTVQRSEFTHSRNIPSPLLPDVELVDMFQELARDRMHARHQQNLAFFSSKDGFNKSDLESSYVMKLKETRDSTTDHGQHASASAICACEDNGQFRHGHSRNCALQQIPQTSPLTVPCDDRGHLSTSILPHHVLSD